MLNLMPSRQNCDAFVIRSDAALACESSPTEDGVRTPCQVSETIMIWETAPQWHAIQILANGKQTPKPYKVPQA